MTDSTTAEFKLAVPDLGEARDVAVIAVLVRPGDRVEVDTPLVTLESDKATMDVPATAAGTIVRVLVGRGDKVATGTLIATLAPEAAGKPATVRDVAATDVRNVVRAAEPYGVEVGFAAVGFGGPHRGA